MLLPGPRCRLRRLERDARHAARAHAGARQARGDARPARAAAPARGPAPHRARLGDAPLPAPDGSGALVVALDLHAYEAVAEHSDGRERARPAHARPAVGEVTRELLAAVRRLAGPVEINLTPQETPWTTPLDEDDEHATFDTAPVDAYLAAATRAALVLAALRAPYRGRSTPVNAWWGSFDLAVSLFSGSRSSRRRTTSSCATPEMPSRSRSAGGPAMRATRSAAFFAYAYPAPAGFENATLSAGRGALGRRRSASSSWTGTTSATTRIRMRVRLQFARSAVRHACAVCGWDPELAASAEGRPPPLPVARAARARRR